MTQTTDTQELTAQGLSKAELTTELQKLVPALKSLKNMKAVSQYGETCFTFVALKGEVDYFFGHRKYTEENGSLAFREDRDEILQALEDAGLNAEVTYTRGLKDISILVEVEKYWDGMDRKRFDLVKKEESRFDWFKIATSWNDYTRASHVMIQNDK